MMKRKVMAGEDRRSLSQCPHSSSCFTYCLPFLLEADQFLEECESSCVLKAKLDGSFFLFLGDFDLLFSLLVSGYGLT